MKVQKITAEEWVTAVDSCTNHWNRYDSNTIILWFGGYKPAICHEAEKHLAQFGGFCTKVEFDSICGKTLMLIKEPGYFKRGRK